MTDKTQEQIDNEAVDQLAVMMKAKLAKKRAEGCGGWDEEGCTIISLSRLLIEAVMKGDAVDVANFCAFIASRGGEVAYPALEPRIRELEIKEMASRMDKLLEVVDLPWQDDDATNSSGAVGDLYCYTVLPDYEDKGKFRAYYGKGRYKQVSSIEEGKKWATQDHLKGKLLNLLRLKVFP